MNFRFRLADFLDRIRIHVIAVNIGDQNEVGFWESGELHGLGGIEIDGLATRLDQRAGMVERSDLDRPGRRGENSAARHRHIQALTEQEESR